MICIGISLKVRFIYTCCPLGAPKNTVILVFGRMSQNEMFSKSKLKKENDLASQYWWKFEIMNCEFSTYVKERMLIIIKFVYSTASTSENFPIDPFRASCVWSLSVSNKKATFTVIRETATVAWILRVGGNQELQNSLNPPLNLAGKQQF